MSEELRILAEDIEFEFIKLLKSKNKRYLKESDMQKHFIEAAKLCLEMQTTPQEYMYAVSKHCKVLHPRMIHPTWLKSAYLGSEEVLQRKVDVHELVEVYKTILKNQLVRCKRPLIDVLMDDNLDLPAWFRVCVTKEVIPTVLKKYQELARKHMTNDIRNYLADINMNIERVQ